jgi:hypothetical protein
MTAFSALIYTPYSGSGPPKSATTESASHANKENASAASKAKNKEARKEAQMDDLFERLFIRPCTLFSFWCELLGTMAPGGKNANKSYKPPKHAPAVSEEDEDDFEEETVNTAQAPSEVCSNFNGAWYKLAKLRQGGRKRKVVVLEGEEAAAAKQVWPYISLDIFLWLGISA